MKNKIIAVFIICILLMGCLCGCSQTVSVEEMQMEIEKSWNKNETYDENSFMNELENSASFQVKSVEREKKNYYLVTLDVTSVDILSGLKQYQSSITQMPSQAEMNEKIKEIIRASSPKTTQQTLTVFQTDQGFSAVFTEDFVDAMCGYGYSYCMDEMQSLLEGDTK